MVARRGTIRTELQVEGAGAGQAEFRKFKKSAETELSAVGRAFTGIQGSVRAFNQYKETFNAVANAVQNFAVRARELLSLNPSTARGFSEVDSAVTAVGRAFADSVNQSGAFRDILRETTRDVGRLADEATRSGSAIRTLLNFMNETRAHDDTTESATVLAGGGLLAAGIAATSNFIQRRQREAENARMAAEEARQQETMRRLGGSGAGMMTPLESEGAEETREFLRDVDDGLTRAAADAEWAARATAAYRENLRAAATEEARRTEQRQGEGNSEAQRRAEAMATKELANVEFQINEALRERAELMEREQWARNEAYATQERGEQRRMDALNRVLDHNRMVAEFEREAADKRKEQLTEQMELEQRLEELQRDRVRGIVNQVAGYGESLLTVGGAIADVFGQLSSEQAEGSKAAERYKKIQGGILAGIAFVNAAIEVARAIGSYPDVVGIVAHSASAAAYVAAGVLALRNLGGTASRPSTSSGFTAAPKKESSSKGAGGAVTNNIIAVGWGNARLARELERTAGARTRGGLERSLQAAGGYR